MTQLQEKRFVQDTVVMTTQAPNGRQGIGVVTNGVLVQK
jgi:hypothetical protein